MPVVPPERPVIEHHSLDNLPHSVRLENVGFGGRQRWVERDERSRLGGRGRRGVQVGRYRHDDSASHKLDRLAMGRGGDDHTVLVSANHADGVIEQHSVAATEFVSHSVADSGRPLHEFALLRPVLRLGQPDDPLPRPDVPKPVEQRHLLRLLAEDRPYGERTELLGAAVPAVLVEEILHRHLVPLGSLRVVPRRIGIEVERHAVCLSEQRIGVQ
mmetsp:Transcript_1472/g.3844  ORF Transcript_1472/g.3844 Transcript_1472/m.3844 type:complete len:215 (-) Transcript_1472:238-882(-)